MKVARLVAPQTFEFQEIADPVPEDGEAKIKIETVSVCASDIHGNYEITHPEEAYPLAPGVPCHEIAGTVVESRTPEVKEGQRAIVLPTRGSGGLAQYIVQSPERIIPIPEWGPVDEWVMCQHSGTVLFSAKRWGNPAGKRIAVLGQGGIGLSFTEIAEKQGARQVVAIDLLDYRLRKSLEIGATHAVNPDQENLVEAIEEITDGEGIDVVVDATGDPTGFETCIQIVRRHGTFISFSLTGASGARSSFVHADFMRKAVTIIPTVIAGTDQPTTEIREMVALKERGWMDPGAYKSHNLPFSEVQRAYDMYANREDEVIKVAMAVE